MSATFLDVLWPNKPELYGEIRAIRSLREAGPSTTHETRQFFIPLEDYRGANGEGVGRQYQSEGYDVYFGVLPRMRMSGTNRDVEQASDILWADIDAKHFSTDLAAGKAAAYEALAGIKVVPQILVASGGGLHAYWLLDRSIAFDYAQVLMKGIARVVGGDAVYDAARVLRLPGTINQKRLPLVEARVLRFDLARTYKPGDFDDLVVVAPQPRHSIPTEYVPNTELPVWLLDLIKTGAPQGERSEACFKCCVWLVRYGRTDDEIEAVFVSTPGGIGSKYAEQKNGSRWLRYTLKAARERA